MNTVIQAIGVRKEAGQWFRAPTFAGLTLSLMMLASGVYTGDSTELDTAVTKWDGWVRGNLGKLAALITIDVGSVVVAVKKDWGWSFGAVVLSMGIGMIVSIVNVSFTAVT